MDDEGVDVIDAEADGVDDGEGGGKQRAILSTVPSVHLYFVQYPCLHSSARSHISHSSFKKHLRKLYQGPDIHFLRKHCRD